MPNVSNLIKTIQDIMRKDAGVDGDAQRLAQLGWMFFLKIFDDRETQLELFDDTYKSPLSQDLRWRSWANDSEGITGEALLTFVDNNLLPKLKTLVGSGRIVVLIRSAFDGANNYMKNGTLMRQVINKINGIDFNASDDRHMFGDIYEKLLKDLQSAGNAGEFYTPRAVTQFIVEQVNPRLGETLLDPACGTGGFLVNAIEHLRKQAKTEEDEKTIQDCFAGIEKKHLPHVLCMTNLLLHGIDVPSNVRHDNTLARPLRDWSPKERVDVIVTNPPFGGMEEDGIESNYPAEFRTRETADLFLVLLMKILKPGGRAGLVLPDGSLFGGGVKTRIKEALLTECNLHTIVRLPNGVFNPYTGIRTNLLFFTKGAPTTHVWYYEHPYPPGAKSYNKGKPIRIEEFEGERAWWGSENDGFNSRVENEHAWKINIRQIIDDARREAQPRWDAAELASKDAKNLRQLISDVKAELKELIGRPSRDRNRFERQLAALQSDLASVEQKARVEMQAGNGIYDAAFNFDLKNPYNSDTGPGDVDHLLPEYEKRVAQLAAIRAALKQELKQALTIVAGAAKMKLETFLDKFDRLVDTPDGVRSVRELVLRLAFSGGLTGNRPAMGGAPDGWESRTIESISASITPGFACSRSHQVENGHVHLRTHNISTLGTLNFDLLVRIDPQRVDPQKASIRAGDILFNNTNSQELVGKTSLVDRDYKYGFSNHITRIRLEDGIFPSFVVFYLTLLRNSGYFARLCTRWINQAAVNSKTLKEQTIPLPPFAEQQRIVAKVEQLLALVGALEAQLAEYRATGANLLSALISELATKPATKVVRPVFEATKYFVQIVAALLRNLNGPVSLDRLNRVIALLFLPDQLLPLVRRVVGSEAESHFRSLAQPNETGSLKKALQVLTRTQTISCRVVDEDIILNVNKAKLPPVDPIIEKDAEYLTRLLDIVPTKAVQSMINTFHTDAFRRELLADVS